MTSGGYDFSDFSETTFNGYGIMKNNVLTHLGEMPGVGGRFATHDHLWIYVFFWHQHSLHQYSSESMMYGY